MLKSSSFTSVLFVLLLTSSPILSSQANAGDGVSPDAEAGIEFQPADLVTYAGDGDLEMVRALVQAGADVNFADEYGITALMNSVSGGHVELVKYLLDAGADARARDAEGYTALLHTVASHGNIAGDPEVSPDYWEIMRVLVAAGCDVNGSSNDGETPLSRARAYRDSEAGQTERLLIGLGAGQ